MVFQLQPQLKIFIMPNVYSPTKSSTLHHIAIVVPHDELVMKSYTLRLAIGETHYHNLNANIKNQNYLLLTANVGIKHTKATKLQHRTKKHWAIFPHFGHFQFKKWYKVIKIIWYTPSNSISWLFSD
jgi:uncharacterized protein (DUF2126 family)